MAFTPLLETGKRPRDEEPVEQPDAKRLRKLKQKQAMRDLRQAEKRIRQETIDDMQETFEMLKVLLLTTADHGELGVKEQQLQGRSSKKKKETQRMRMLAAQCKQATKILYDKTNH